jgi:phenylacetate-CoA ligase
MKKSIWEKLTRRLILFQLKKIPREKLLILGNKKLLQAFRRAAKRSPAYKILLEEQKIGIKSIFSVQDFVELCPILDKSNTFHRFSLRQLIADDVSVNDLASILTSSGHGSGGFALGLSTRIQFKTMPSMIDLGLEMAFEIDRYRTLLINCLPMGVTFQSNTVCVANVSVREDMACAIVEQAGDMFDQIILCGDPLFLKKLCDYSQAKKIDWGRYRVNVIVGEETFTESFRSYLAHVLKISLDSPAGGLIGSSMGIGELGLNLFNETRETIALRQACNNNSNLLARLFGSASTNHTIPTFLVFNPLRVFVEIDSFDENGIGDLLVSVLDPETPIPLLRYKTGDRVKWLSSTDIAEGLQSCGVILNLPHLPIIALLGRSKDCLPNGGHVDQYKQVLYQQPHIAEQLTGAFRVSERTDGFLWEIQVRKGIDIDLGKLSSDIRTSLAIDWPAASIICYSFENFPYGRTLDYERKFVYWQNQ